jgi:DNA polymerase I-like protein with 3'-5' exonuclease and polymerase domains
VIDVHPDEVNDIINVIKNVNTYITQLIQKQFKIEINVPLLLEAKIGNNWLDTKDVI